MLDWPLYTTSPNRECLYKVASPGKTPEKTESMLDWPLYTTSPNRECLYKVASPTFLDWPLYRGILCFGRGIKVQHRFGFFRGFTWTGHFIEKKISLERGPQGEWGPGQLYKVTWMMYLMTL